MKAPSSLTNLQKAILTLKFSALAILFWLDTSGFIIENAMRRSHDHLYWKLAGVVGFTVTCFILILLASFARNRLLRIIMMFFVVVTIFTNIVADRLTGSFLDDDFLAEMIEVFDDVAMAFISEQLFGLSTILLVVVGLTLLLSYAPVKTRISSYFAFSIPVLLALLFALVSVIPKADVAKFSPSPFSLIVHLSKGVEKLNYMHSLKRSPVAYDGDIGTGIEKIVLIIDESLYGGALEINGGPAGAIPYLKQQSDILINFGIIGSGSNRSAPSNLILRSGLPHFMIPDTKYNGFTRPTIWQYANKAGYRSVYINAWPSLHHNYFTKEELRFIDEVYGGFTGDRSYSDFLAAVKLVEILNSDGKAFIIVQKEGAHWPYARAYPRGSGPYYPVVKSVDFTRMPGRSAKIDKVVSEKLGVMPLMENKPANELVNRLRKMAMNNPGAKAYDSGSLRMNLYLNAVNWTVDEFFRFTLQDIDLNKTLILFTSDHGQYVSTDNEFSVHFTGHGSLKDPHPEEGMAPLIAFTTHESVARRLRASAVKSFNKMTHFALFPTLVNMMGYNEDWVRGNLGPSIFDPAGPERFFFYGTSIFSEGESSKYYLDRDKQNQ